MLLNIPNKQQALGCWIAKQVKESIVDFTKTIKELDCDILYVYTNSCCIHFFSLIKKLNFKSSSF